MADAGKGRNWYRDKGGKDNPANDDGDEGGDMVSRHAEERSAMRERHMSEHKEMGNRHEAEHSEPPGADEKPHHAHLRRHRKHARERHEAHVRHSQEHSEMAHRHAAEMEGDANMAPGSGGGQAAAGASDMGAAPTGETA